MVVDRDKAAEYPAVNNVKAGEGAPDMVFPVLKERLHHLKLFPGYDGFMLPLIAVLIHVLPVLFAPVLEQV